MDHWKEALLALWSEDIKRRRNVQRRRFFLDWAASIIWKLKAE